MGKKNKGSKYRLKNQQRMAEFIRKNEKRFEEERKARISPMKLQHSEHGDHFTPHNPEHDPLLTLLKPPSPHLATKTNLFAKWNDKQTYATMALEGLQDNYVADFVTNKKDLIFYPKPSTHEKESKKLNDFITIMPPLEIFMGVPNQLCKKHLFESLSSKSVVVGVVSSLQERGVTILLLCLDHFGNRDIAHLRISAFCPSAELGHFQHHNALKLKDIIKAAVMLVNKESEEIIITLKADALPQALKSVKLGVITEEELPLCYRKSVHVDNREVEEILGFDPNFMNTGLVENFRQLMTVCEENPPSLMHWLHGLTVPEGETAAGLRKYQTSRLAAKTVADAVRCFKDGKQLETMQLLNKALSIDERSVDALVARGALYANNESYERAIEDFEQALQYDAKHANAQKYLFETIMTYVKTLDGQENIEKSIRLVERAAQLRPDDEAVKTRQRKTREASPSIEETDGKKKAKNKKKKKASSKSRSRSSSSVEVVSEKKKKSRQQKAKRRRSSSTVTVESNSASSSSSRSRSSSPSRGRKKKAKKPKKKATSSSESRSPVRKRKTSAIKKKRTPSESPPSPARRKKGSATKKKQPRGRSRSPESARKTGSTKKRAPSESPSPRRKRKESATKKKQSRDRSRSSESPSPKKRKKRTTSVSTKSSTAKQKRTKKKLSESPPPKPKTKKTKNPKKKEKAKSPALSKTDSKGDMVVDITDETSSRKVKKVTDDSKDLKIEVTTNQPKPRDQSAEPDIVLVSVKEASSSPDNKKTVFDEIPPPPAHKIAEPNSFEYLLSEAKKLQEKFAVEEEKSKKEEEERTRWNRNKSDGIPKHGAWKHDKFEESEDPKEEKAETKPSPKPKEEDDEDLDPKRRPERKAKSRSRSVGRRKSRSRSVKRRRSRSRSAGRRRSRSSRSVSRSFIRHRTGRRSPSVSKRRRSRSRSRRRSRSQRRSRSKSAGRRRSRSRSTKRRSRSRDRRRRSRSARRKSRSPSRNRRRTRSRSTRGSPDEVYQRAYGGHGVMAMRRKPDQKSGADLQEPVVSSTADQSKAEGLSSVELMESFVDKLRTHPAETLSQRNPMGTNRPPFDLNPSRRF